LKAIPVNVFCRPEGINAAASTTLAVAPWGYSNAMGSGGQAWLKSRAYEPIHEGYMDSWDAHAAHAQALSTASAGSFANSSGVKLAFTNQQGS
jgi:hypothetical protein